MLQQDTIKLQEMHMMALSPLHLHHALVSTDRRIFVDPDKNIMAFIDLYYFDFVQICCVLATLDLQKTNHA